MKYQNAIEALKLDASENAFASRALETVRSKVYEVQYPALVWSRLMGIDSSIDPMAETFRTIKMQAVGQAKLGSDYSTAGNRASVIIGEEVGTIRVLKEFYAFTFFELQRAARFGTPLQQMTANAARLAIEQAVDDIMIIGDGTAAYLGLFGIAKQSGTVTYTTAGAWSGLTTDNLLNELNGAVHKVVNDSNGVEVPNKMALDLESYGHISTRRVTDTNETVMSFFLRTNPYVKEIVPVSKLLTAGAGGVKRAIVYNDSTDKLSAILPVAFEQLDPQPKDYSIETHCHARIGGCQVNYPKSICYLDHTI